MISAFARVAITWGIAMSSVLAQTPRTSRIQEFPFEQFAADFQKIHEASEDGFQALRGAPLPGKDMRPDAFPELGEAHTYIWKSKVTPPFTQNCQIEVVEWSRDEVQDRLPARLYCDLRFADIRQVAAAIQAALGPGWGVEWSPSSPYLENGKPAFLPGGALFWKTDERRIDGRRDHRVILSGTRALKAGVVPAKAERFVVTAPERKFLTSPPKPVVPDDGNSIETAVERISSAEFVPLPRAPVGMGTGPVTIRNSTSGTLTIYFSGPAKTQHVILPHSTRSITLTPGMYKVAAELSDHAVKPFFGVRNYSGGESETFILDVKK